MRRTFSKKGITMRLLFINDDSELVTALAERLAPSGAHADYASCGKEALTLARMNRYDVAVMNVKKSGLNGFELVKGLRGLQPTLKVICVTDTGAFEHRVDGLEPGSCAILTKPVTVGVLLSNVNAALGACAGRQLAATA